MIYLYRMYIQDFIWYIIELGRRVSPSNLEMCLSGQGEVREGSKGPGCCASCCHDENTVVIDTVLGGTHFFRCDALNTCLEFNRLMNILRWLRWFFIDAAVLWVSFNTQMTGTSTFFQDLWMRHWRRYFLDHHSWQYIISCRWRMWSLDWYGVIQKCLGSISKVVSLLGMLHCCKIWQAWRMWIICRSFRFFLHWNKETFGLLQAVGPRLRWSADFGWHLEEVGVQFTVHFSHFIIPLPWYWISNGWISTMMWYLVPSRPSMCDMTSRWRWIWVCFKSMKPLAWTCETLKHLSEVLQDESCPGSHYYLYNIWVYLKIRWPPQEAFNMLHF